MSACNSKCEWLVYVHTNKTNNKKYVGITSKTPGERWREGKGYHGGSFSAAIAKYGWDNFDHEVLYAGLSESDAKNIEKKLIKELNLNDSRYGYNRTDGGDGVCGLEFSEETRKKMSKSHIGNKHSEATKKKMSEAALGNKKWLGKTHTIDTKNKISQSNKKYYQEHPLSEEDLVLYSVRAKSAYEKDPTLRDRLSNSRKKYFEDNPEARNKMSELHKKYFEEHPEARERISDRMKKKVNMYRPSGEFIKSFDSITEASIETQTDRSSISRSCNGKQKIAGGYIWKYCID